MGTPSPSRASGGATSAEAPAPERIRDAAIAVIAEQGPGSLTVRRVAERAGVSPALVIHHYSSMDALRRACDEHVAGTIRGLKSEAMAAGPDLDPLAAVRRADLGPLAAYLAAVLAEDTPAVARLVDELVADAESYIGQGVSSGLLQPTSDPRGRAVILTIWNLGLLVLHRHLARLIGVDPTSPDYATSPATANLVGPLLEIYGQGLLTPEAAAQTAAARHARKEQL